MIRACKDCEHFMDGRAMYRQPGEPPLCIGGTMVCREGPVWVQIASEGHYCGRFRIREAAIGHDARAPKPSPST